MSRPIAPKPGVERSIQLRSMRRLVVPTPTRLARFWVWLNTPLKG